MKLIWNRIVQALDGWEKRENLLWQQEKLLELSAGIDMGSNLLDEMEKKGWRINIDFERTRLFSQGGWSGLVGAFDRSTHAFLSFTAEKEGKDQNSIHWYRDLCDVLGFQRDAIPDCVVRRQKPDFADFML